MSYVVSPKRRLMILLASAAAGTTVQTLPTDLRGCKDIVFQSIVTACTGGSDAVDFTVQASHDKVSWFTWVSFTQATAATNEIKPAIGTDGIVPRWARISSVVAAGATVSAKVYVTYKRAGDGQMPPTKAALTTAVGAHA